MTLSGTSEAGSTVWIYDGANTTPLATVTAGSTGAWSFSTRVTDTVHSFSAEAMDAAGNTGTSSGVALLGSTGNDTLTGAPSDLIAGRGGSDTFVFGANFGKETITDFQPSGGGHDIIQFSQTEFSSFAAVLAHAAQVGSDVAITYDANDAITLQNVKLSSLVSADFHLV